MRSKLFFFLFIFNSVNLFSQETAKPLTDTEIIRNTIEIDIEGNVYENVKIILKSISPDYFVSEKHKVKVTILDVKGKVVWRKTLKNVYLYVFSDGQIQVGQKNFTRILISKNNSGSYIGKIRESEGVY
jgi:hypothetical protein